MPLSAPRPIEADARRGLPMTWLPLRRLAFRPSVSSPASFVRAWQSCVEGWGQPSTAFVTIPHATTGQQADFIRTMVDTQIDAIIRGLTALPASVGTTSGATG